MQMSGGGYVASTFNNCMTISPVFFSLLIAVLMSILLFGFTCWSLRDKAFATQSCHDYNPYTPFVIKYITKDNGHTYATYQCGWRSNNQALRFIISLISIFSPIAIILIMNKKLPNFILWVYAAICIVFAGLFFWAAVIDGQRMNDSKNFWDDAVKSIDDDDVKVETVWWPYIVTILIDTLDCIAWLISGLLIGRFKWRGGINSPAGGQTKQKEFDMPWKKTKKKEFQ